MAAPSGPQADTRHKAVSNAHKMHVDSYAIYIHDTQARHAITGTSCQWRLDQGISLLPSLHIRVLLPRWNCRFSSCFCVKMPERQGRLALNLLASPPPQTRGQVASRVSAPLDLCTPRRSQQPEARAVSGRTAFGHNAWETARETHASRARSTLAHNTFSSDGPRSFCTTLAGAYSRSSVKY